MHESEITDVSHCKRMRVLTVTEKLQNFCDNVEELDISGENFVTNEILMLCKSLKVLVAKYNPRITICPPWVESLDISAYSHGPGPRTVITNLSECSSLRVLKAYGNLSVRDIPAGLETLALNDNNAISDLTHCLSLKCLWATRLPNLERIPGTLEKLSVTDCPRLRSILHCEKLKELWASGKVVLDGMPASLRSADLELAAPYDLSMCANLTSLSSRSPVVCPANLERAVLARGSDYSACTRLLELFIKNKGGLCYPPLSKQLSDVLVNGNKIYEYIEE